MNNSVEIDILEYFRVIKKRWKAIAIIVSTAFVCSVVISLILPKTYRATASVLPPQGESSMSSMMMSKAQAGVGGGLGNFLGLKSPADLWLGILRSNNVSDAIISRFKLKELFGMQAIEDVRQSLSYKVEIKKTKEEIIVIAVVDSDPKRAADMANAFVEELDRVNKGLGTTGGQRTRVFLEERLVLAKGELERLEGELRKFQEGSNAVRIDEQSKAVMEAIGQVKGNIIAKEVELETFLTYTTDENPQVKTVRTQLSEFRKKQRELESGKGDYGVFLPINRVPGLSVRYAEFVRDLKVQETLFELLTQQYEMAKIQEAKDSPTIQVLDEATPPDKKYKPKRSLIVMSATLLSFCAGVIYAFVADFRDRRVGAFL